MPQVSPMDWLILSMTMMMSIHMLPKFSYTQKNNKNKKLISNKTIEWKW
uniref:ATP synthase subunit 8 n=1 Tax=Unionicola parkeri TaxID=350891 RepID=E3W3L6_9ACAR|nr:ATP synthase F0 subunit 8 [Unionicola parkeri]ADP01826.1 ATP synthase subunit 8 [Unionicola parkeri]